MLPTNPEFRPRTDAELVALTDTRYHGAVTISMALELIDARRKLAELRKAFETAENDLRRNDDRA